MSKHFEIFRQADAETAAAEAGEHLNLLLIENKQKPVLLMLSGGSSLAMLDYVGQTALGANLSVSVLDERFSQDSKINNFAQLQKTDFYKLAFDAESSFFGTLPRSEDTIESFTTRWQTNIKTWVAENPDGIIIATLGMGADGHTAGMFPHRADEFDKLFNSGDWLTAYNAGNKSKYPERVTATLALFKIIDVGLAYVCGPGKKNKLDEVVKHQGKIHELPALAWQEIKNVSIFTDIE